MLYGQVTIGLSVYRDVHVNTLTSIIRMMDADGVARPAHWSIERGCYVHKNRERILQKAVALESTYLMFIDADVAFPPFGIEQLINAGKDIIGGEYNVRDAEPPTSAVRIWGKDEEGRACLDYVIEKHANNPPRPAHLGVKPFQCAVVPTGFMCINLEKLRAKWPNGPYFSFRGDMGEDASFCLAAEERGLEVWCDPTIEIQHMGEKAY